MHKEDLSQEEIAHRLEYHAPGDMQVLLHSDIRMYIKAAYQFINGLRGGPSREKSIALTHLEDAMMWANAHVARNTHEE